MHTLRGQEAAGNLKTVINSRPTSKRTKTDKHPGMLPSVFMVEYRDHRVGNCLGTEGLEKQLSQARDYTD